MRTYFQYRIDRKGKIYPYNVSYGYTEIRLRAIANGAYSSYIDEKIAKILLNKLIMYKELKNAYQNED